MITRRDILSDAVDNCMKELYSFAKPSIEWDKFMEENKIYSKVYKEWERYRDAYYNREKYPEKWKEIKSKYESLDWDENKSITECIGPRPFEFYYLPREVLKDICDSYVSAYRIDHQQELLNTIEILKDYCRKPIVDKYIEEHTDEYGNWHPGYRSYDHPDNLEKEVEKYLREKFTFISDEPLKEIESHSNELQNKFFKFLDMAGNFYNWNAELNSFNMTVYLGCSPNSNKEAVIENWKKYRNQDIEIDEEQIKKDYYGEEDFDE